MDGSWEGRELPSASKLEVARGGTIFLTAVLSRFPGLVWAIRKAAIKTALGATIPTPSSPRTGSAEYVWHCHILEHEEHDMMRPLIVI